MTRPIADIITEAHPGYVVGDPRDAVPQDQRSEYDRLAQRMNPSVALAIMRERIRRREVAASFDDHKLASAVVAKLRR
ncbi:hypothetical protein J2Y69_001388 [Microbacterium resistens]|uniref:Uncharacterized protein n=1 Tax=Microbacterium resistens TaxID=156977 RepID=A0ABU1SB05_9MICO|nr:hypothetical protein [Microbacterium resistens]MDR6866789.1 hypothetical protein [Microbacterium resistens]